MRGVKKILLSALVVGFSLSKGVAQTLTSQQVISDAPVELSAERRQRIDQIIHQSVDHKEIAGGIGFIARGGKIIYNKAFGYSDWQTEQHFVRTIFFVLLLKPRQLQV